MKNVKDEQPTYVLDTNILVDYPNVIFAGDALRPEEPTIDLTGAHLVIPSAVIRELSSFKKEKTERGKTARVLLRRLRDLFEEDIEKQSFHGQYHLENSLELPETNQRLSILPVHKNFTRNLPFKPSSEDMDGQIILTTLSVIAIKLGYDIDGGDYSWMKGYKQRNVTLLTNDNGLAIRARLRGIRTCRYGYKYPKPYTGRRDLKVPKELFDMLFLQRRVERTEFERLMPDEPRLVANEFIIMEPEDLAQCKYYDPTDNSMFSNVGRYDKNEDAIVPLKFVASFPVTPQSVGQALYAEALSDTSISAVICAGPAGSGKTYMATIYGYMACRAGLFIGMAVVPCENSSKLGALPGGLYEKMDPQVQPLKNALRNYLLTEDPSLRRKLANMRKFGEGALKSDEYEGKDSSEDDEADGEKVAEGKKSAKGGKRSGKNSRNCYTGKEPKNGSVKMEVDSRVELIWRNWYSVVPIENARGRDFAHELAIFDEFQDQTISQANTLLTRIGIDGKIVVTGDVEQIHAPYLDENNNGLVYASGLLYDSPMVAQVTFTDEDVVRSPLVKLITERQSLAKAHTDDT